MRIGLLGGSFNPVHNGHLAMAQAALDALALDRVLFIPAAAPPHKTRGLLPYETRFRLVAESLAGHPAFLASDLDRPGDRPNYTFFLIDRVREAFPGCDPFFLIGEDNLSELPRWFRWRELLDKVTIAAFTRIGGKREHPDFSGRIVRIPMKPVRISSTAIRRRLRAGLPVGDRVPKPVEDFLATHPDAFL